MNKNTLDDFQTMPLFDDCSEEAVIWSDKMRPLFGLPLSFTKYVLYADRLMVESGLVFFRVEELRLYRICDLTLHQTILQRLFGVGTLRLCTFDASGPRISVHDIKNPQKVMRVLSLLVEAERQRNGVRFVEGFESHPF